MTPLVSIIIPVYNCETYVAEAVDSALGQDYPNKEVIVVNDGSTDGTMKVLSRYGDRIRVIDQVNGGPPRARNVGLQAVRGEYIAFLDADDIWLQGKISAQVAHLEANPDVGTCYFAWHVWPADADGVFQRPAFSEQPLKDVKVNAERSGWIYGRLLFDCELLTTTVMVRTRTAREVGEFNVDFWNGDDYDFWLRLSQAAKISRLEPAGALYRAVVSSVSRHVRAVNDEWNVVQGVVGRYGLSDSAGNRVDPERLRRRMDGLVFQYGYIHLRKGNPAIALASFSDNLRFNPWRAKLWVHAAEAWLKRALKGGSADQARKCA